MPSGRFFYARVPSPQRPTPAKETPKPRTYKPRIPAGENRPKSGGRKKGTLNKSTVAIREAVLSVFADMQATTGRENGHFLDWALGNATDFYKLSSKLLPTQVTGADGGPVITRIELVAPTAEDIAQVREDGWR